MFILGLDFETNSDQASSTDPTEVGAVLYKVEKNSFIKLKEFSSFCYEPTYPKQTKKIIEITGITDEMLINEGRSRRDVFVDLLALVKQADLVIAHKEAFDRVVLESNCKLLGLPVPEKEWLCTLANFPWPTRITCHKLSHIAYEHDIEHDRKSLHRAVNDVDLMMQILSKYNFEEVLTYARAPWIYLKAEIMKPWEDGGLQAKIAKGLGFSFESVKGTDHPKWPKSWVLRTKDIKQVEEIKKTAFTCLSPFRVYEIVSIS